jgi:phosphonate transport system ATP-binding protein
VIPNPLVALDSLDVARGGRNVLHAITLRIAPAERVSLIGPNGAGKTTLLRALAQAAAPQARVAFVWQGLHLVQRLSVLENVLLGALGRCRSPATWLRRFPKAEEDRAAALLRTVGIEHLSHERADRLSGGERQRVAIARALMQDGDILLADEPTASLDWTTAREVAALLCSVASDRGMALVTVVHDIELTELLGDRLVLLGDGHVEYDGARMGLTQEALARVFKRTVDSSAAG